MSDCNKRKRNIIDMSKHKDLEDEFMEEVPIKKKAKRCIHGKRAFYCKECDGRRLCIHDKCKYTCCICRGSGVCKHDKSKYNCRLCLQENEINKLKEKINDLKKNNSQSDHLDLLIKNFEENEEQDNEKIIEQENDIIVEQEKFDFVFSSGYYKLEILREKNRHKEDTQRKNIELRRVELELKKIDLELLRTKLKLENN